MENPFRIALDLEGFSIFQKNVSSVMSKKVLGRRFQLEGKLGEGGMGSVYRALDLQTRRTVAVKILRKDLSESRHARRRFAREARAAGMLDHPNIVGWLVIHHACG